MTTVAITVTEPRKYRFDWTKPVLWLFAAFMSASTHARLMLGSRLPSKLKNTGIPGPSHTVPRPVP